MEGLMQGFPIPIYFKEDIGLDIEIPKDLLPEGEVMTKLKSKELKDDFLYSNSKFSFFVICVLSFWPYV